MFFHTLQSLAAFFGYYTITDAKERLFGVFDNGALNPDYGENFRNNAALAWDLINHTFVASGFSGVVIAVALGPFLLAEFMLDPNQFPEYISKWQ